MTLLCQRVGCSSRYAEEANAEGGCRYHSGLPSFRDGLKEWTCCGARSTDFAAFMGLPGCCTGRHTQEKPAKPAPAPAPALQPQPQPLAPARPQAPPEGEAAAGRRADASTPPASAPCARCAQGFFCAEHASATAPAVAAAPPVQARVARPAAAPAPPRRRLSLR